eukprot:Em0002g1585a
MPSRNRKIRKKQRAEYLQKQEENEAKARERYKADPEKKKASVRESYKADPEKKKASVRESYKADPEKKKASVRESYKADPEKKKASVRESYIANIEVIYSSAVSCNMTNLPAFVAYNSLTTTLNSSTNTHYTLYYHPQSDGLVERFNRTMLAMLASTVEEDPSNWEQHLRKVCMAYNTSVQPSTGYTPFYLMFGRLARLPVDIMYGSCPTEPVLPHQYVKTLKDTLESAYTKARKHMQATAMRSEELYNRRVHGQEYEVGDLVWLNNLVVPKGKSRKLHCPWTGPFKIIKKLSSVVYRIQDKRPGSRKRVVVHFDWLKPCPADIRMKPVVEDLHNSDANEQPVQFPGSDLQFFEDDDHDVMVDSTETNVTRKADQPGTLQEPAVDTPTEQIPATDGQTNTAPGDAGLLNSTPSGINSDGTVSQSETVTTKSPMSRPQKRIRQSPPAQDRYPKRTRHAPSRYGWSVEDQFVEDQFVKDQSVKDEWDAVATSISALLTSVGESPVDKRRIGNKRYAEGKLKMIEQNVRKKLKLEPSKDDFQEVLEQLKRKFNGCAKKSEKLQVLTILPQSWSIKRIEMEFGTTNHMARLAKALVASKGILAAPNPRSGKTLSDDTMQLVKLFYLNDTVSRVMPGKKDCVSIVVDGEKEAVQKRLLLCNLSEAYKQFQSDHPDVKIGLTKFTELRPKNVVLAGASASANLRKHDFIAKQQASFLADLKANLKEGEVIIMGDFSENYSFIIQDAVQVAVHLFVRKLLEFLTAKIVVEKVYYFSDGAASQYKNRKNFVNLAFYMEDFKLPAEWHFFATAHGKGPPLEDQIQSPMQLYEWAKGAIPSVQFHYVDVAEIDAAERILQKRLDASITIAGTQSFHAYYALPNKTSMLRVKIYSNSSKSEIAKVSNHRELLSKEDMAGYVICEYNSQWWLAMIMENYDDIHEVQVLFLHPAGPSPSFSFPRRQDKLNINYTQVLMKVNPTTSTGRVYSIKPEEALQATLLLHA